MNRISIPSIGLFAIGVLMVILAGINTGIPPSSDLERYLPYFLFIGGCALIVAAVVIMLRKR